MLIVPFLGIYYYSSSFNIIDLIFLLPFILVWIFLIWRLRWPCRPYCLPQILHLLLIFPSWTIILCSRTEAKDLNFWLHISQGYVTFWWMLEWKKKTLKSFYYSIFSNIILFKYFLPFFMSIEIISTKKSHATGIAMVIFFSSSMHSFHMLHKIASYAKFFWTIFTFPIFSALMNNWKKFQIFFVI